MKKITLTFFVVLLSCIIPCIAFADLNTGLIGYWNFDDCTLNDSTGNGHTGYLIGNSTCSDSGILGNSFNFDGVYSPDYIYVPNTSSLSFNGNFTISLWFNIRSYISMHGYGGISEFGNHALFSKAGDRNGLSIRTERTNPDGLLRVFAQNGRCCGPDGKWITTSTGFILNEWHMISFTHGNGEVKIYLDGVLEASMSSGEFNLNPMISSQNIQFGIDQWSNWYPLNGMLDEIRVYARALSDSEIQALYQNTIIIDTDIDGIPDDQDNCPDAYNPDQFDNDADGTGDVCDDDDDNDGISDGDDNCQLNVNPDQTDNDLDGYGNVCDSDDDNDGVTDANDQCILTVAGQVVNETGCSIADLCPCDNPWKNHGVFVSCVAKTATGFLDQGLITEAEKDAIVSVSATSSCGQK